MQKLCDWFKKMSVVEKVLLAVCLIALIGTGIYICTGSIVYFHSDTVSTHYYSKVCIESKTLLPDTWRQATFVTLWGINIPITILNLFMDNQIVIHSISALIIMMTALISTFLMARYTFKNNSFLVIVPFLFCSISGVYSDMVFSQCTYAVHMYTLFFCLAFFMKSIDEKFRINNKLTIIFLFVALVTFNMTGITNLQSVVIPMLGSIVFVYLYEHKWKMDKTTLKYPLVLCGLICCATVLALIINKVLIEPRANAGGFAESVTVFQSLFGVRDSFGELIDGFLYLLGIKADVSLFSLDGISNVIRIAIGILCFFVFPAMCIKNFKNEPFNVKLLIVFTCIHVIEVLLILIFCSKNTPYDAIGRYLLTSAYLLYTLSGYWIYSKLVVRKDLIKVFAACCLGGFVVVFTVPQITYLNEQYKLDYDRVHGLSNILEENDLTYGYATYWHANSSMVLSDFKVVTSPVKINENRITPHYWLCDERVFSENNELDKSFLFLTKSEYNVFSKNGQIEEFIYGKPIEVIRFNDHYILVFDYNIACNNFEGRTGIMNQTKIGEYSQRFSESIPVNTLTIGDDAISIFENLNWDKTKCMEIDKYDVNKDAGMLSPYFDASMMDTILSHEEFAIMMNFKEASELKDYIIKMDPRYMLKSVTEIEGFEVHLYTRKDRTVSIQEEYDGSNSHFNLSGDNKLDIWGRSVPVQSNSVYKVEVELANPLSKYPHSEFYVDLFCEDGYDYPEQQVSFAPGMNMDDSTFVCYINSGDISMYSIIPYLRVIAVSPQPIEIENVSIALVSVK